MADLNNSLKRVYMKQVVEALWKCGFKTGRVQKIKVKASFVAVEATGKQMTSWSIT